MTTATDDIGPRLAAVEAHITNINTQLDRMHSDIQEFRREHQADIRSLHARIDRIQWSIIGFGSALIITMLGMIITLILKL